MPAGGGVAIARFLGGPLAIAAPSTWEWQLSGSLTAHLMVRLRKSSKMAWVTLWVMAVFRIRKRRELSLNHAIFDSAAGHHEIKYLEPSAILGLWNISPLQRA